MRQVYPRPRIHGQSIEDRFMDKVLICPMSGCWIWHGTLLPSGYGFFSLGTKADGCISAHRAAWILFRGPIGDGLCVCHVHDDRWCVNPDHLFIGTKKDNYQDSVKKGRARWQGRTHCHRGHDLRLPDAYTSKGKHRQCRQCVVWNKSRRRQEQPIFVVETVEQAIAVVQG